MPEATQTATFILDTKTKGETFLCLDVLCVTATTSHGSSRVIRNGMGCYPWQYPQRDENAIVHSDPEGESPPNLRNSN